MTNPPQDPFSSPSGAPSGQPPAYGSQPPPYRQPPGYGPPPPAYGQPAYGQPAYGQPGHLPDFRGVPQETETKAVLALVLAVSSFMLFPVLPAIGALVLAPSARRDIAASHGRLQGEGLVKAATIVAWIHLALCLLVVLGLVVLLLVLDSTGFSEGGGADVYPALGRPVAGIDSALRAA